jgi:phosphoribosylformylglycinamidine synthase
MGAAGLTSSSVEMASKGGAGIELDLDQVPVRETGMTPYEIMLSESQERMLMVLRPGAEDRARAVFEKWELDFSVIGRVTDSQHVVLRWHGDMVADMPVEPLAEGVKYDRPWQDPPVAKPLPNLPTKPHNDALLDLLAGPDLGSRLWVWDQYDHMVMADTVQRPGGDAAVVRVHGTSKGLAMTADCTPRYCEADPKTGGLQAVAEAWRNLTAVGARPLAITDCLNFGNPERPHVMGQFVRALEGMAEACRALAFPVVSGNVSFYNETEQRNIPPTPQVGGVGLIDDIGHMATVALSGPDHALILIGESGGHLGQSLYARLLIGEDRGAPPPVDLDIEKRNGDFVRDLIRSERVSCCHDISDGGLYVAVAEMAIAGDIGVDLSVADDPGALFGEDQARYVLAVPEDQADGIIAQAVTAKVPAAVIGRTGGATLTRNGANAISVGDLRAAHQRWLPAFMNGIGD